MKPPLGRNAMMKVLLKKEPPPRWWRRWWREIRSCFGFPRVTASLKEFE